MNYWLCKSEPETYSWQDLVNDGSTIWDGVRNYAARNNLRAMQVGDRILFYHSNYGREIVGIAEVSVSAFPDPSDDTGTWSSIIIKPLRAFKRPVSLDIIKADVFFLEMILIKNSRLSVQPVTKKEYDKIIQMGG